MLKPLDDVLSFLITIGSPALALYSLQITRLNGRWIADGFSYVDYPGAKRIPAVLSAFHHVPVRISHDPPLHSLSVLHEKNKFWDRLEVAANKTRRWSIPLGMNFVLVIFAAILTVLDSLFSPRPGDIGYGIAATWTFLLPLVIGWLRVGCEPEPNHLKNSLTAANEEAWAATAQRGDPAQNSVIEFMKPDDVGPAGKDELKPVPLFNYSRAFVWASSAERALKLAKAAPIPKQDIPVGNPTGRGPLTSVEDEKRTISNENRVGGSTEVTQHTTSNESRIGTDAEVIDYPRDRPRALLGLSPTNPLTTAPSDETRSTDPLISDDLPAISQNQSRWATGIWERVAISAALALGLQWGTVGAAVLIHYLAPPAGLGCRAFSFMLYGVTGTISFLFFLASSILAHMSRPRQEWEQGYEDKSSRARGFQETGAIICRRAGKCIAILSAIGIMLVCFFQITGAFNNCFCTSTTFDKGRGSVVFLSINYIIGSNILRIWIGGLIMAVSTAVLFGISIYL